MACDKPVPDEKTVAVMQGAKYQNLQILQVLIFMAIFGSRQTHGKPH
jgi:hypothetical protein